MLKKEKHSKKISKPIVWISIAGISLGLAVMIITISIATGFQSEIKQKLLSFGNHIQIERLYKNSNYESSPISTIDFPIDSIIKNNKIRSIHKFAYKPAIIQTKNNSLKNKDGITIREVEGIVFKGLEENYNKNFLKKYLIHGKMPKFKSIDNDTVILSNITAKKLRTNINEKISAFFIIDNKPKQRNFILGGIYETGLQNIDEKFGFIGLNKLSALNKWPFSKKESNLNYTGGYEIVLKNFKDCNSTFIKENIKPFFNAEFSITTIKERHNEIFKWLELIYQNVYIIIVLMIVVSIINMTAALLVLIIERTKMIGILKSIGMKNWGIRKIFIFHGGFLIGTGFFFGNLLAFIIIFLQNHFEILTLPQENYFLNVVPMHFPIKNIVYINLISFAVCFFALVLPSFLTTKISPVKAIQTEI
tara:strand:+ start:1078 stop:2337 length:1260 start_codon:yes stop_codon:yes gene_type:complete